MFQLESPYHIAVPTAFFEDERLNVEATINHIVYLQNQGINSVLVCGSTGEQHSLTLDEKLELAHGIEKENRLSKKLEIIFGVASIRQKEAVLLAKELNKNKKISGILLGFPPYILPTQEEAIIYVETITKELNKPIILYNHPGRTGFNLTLESLSRLSKLPQMFALKEAGDKTRLIDIKNDLIIYTGGEVNLAESIALGCNRLSSIAGNIYPKEVEQWFEELLSGSQAKFKYQKELDDLYQEKTLVKLKLKITEKEQIEMGKPRSPLGN